MQCKFECYCSAYFYALYKSLSILFSSSPFLQTEMFENDIAYVL